MQRVTVSLGERGYTISIAPGLFAEGALLQPLQHKGAQVMVVTNETVAPLYLQQVTDTLQQSGVLADALILPDGEQYKSLETLEQIFSKLLRHNYGRDSVLIALGGGVIGDITGFAAACYQRGVRFIQMPTTLLAQVDSSVGGKTGVNHPLGKNMIGAFYQPLSVIIDLNCLGSLPEAELSAGLAEVIKYGVILDGDFFCWLEQNMEALLALEPEAMAYCIRRCCELKAEVVAADEREKGLRALLNLGHTFGHAIETEMGYGRWLHGEAVAVGMLMAAETARRLNRFPDDGCERLRALLQRAKLPLVGPVAMRPEDYLPHMMRDKKNRQGRLHLVLPLDIGKAEVCTGVDQDLITEAIASCLL